MEGVRLVGRDPRGGRAVSQARGVEIAQAAVAAVIESDAPQDADGAVFRLWHVGTRRPVAYATT